MACYITSAKSTSGVGDSFLSQETGKDVKNFYPDRELRKSNSARRKNVRLGCEAVPKGRIAHLNNCKAGALSDVTAKMNTNSANDQQNV